ncbi:LCCL domain-containing protein [Devosia lacusdianchii]|uniref:LCCL domain-containing protein n=1 Tax=Devosia lacusdianchii TaxID=2917991 RepID=UPI001F06E5C7|nr:LCCL domain-containing protein [Devosia sp. JXJ CY 41]
MFPTGAATLLFVSAIVLVLVQGTLAQSPSVPQVPAKLGTPTMTVPSTAPSPDPGSLFNHAGSIGKTLRFVVVGNTRGGVWGDGIYTSDSVLAAAAVHAGLLEPGEGGIVSLEVIEGPASYAGAERHGVTSLAYGAWDIAYRLVGVEPIDGATTLPDPGNLTQYRGQNGTIFKFEVVGSLAGSVWGDGVYTDDSALAVAAVHAGALRLNEAGVVAVEILPGQSAYAAADANGVISSAYAEWSGSYRIVPALGAKVSSKLSN